MALITAKCICYVLLPGLLWEADKNRNIWHKTHICYPQNVLTGLLGSDSHDPPQPQRKLHFADKMLITRPNGCVSQMDSRKERAEPEGQTVPTEKSINWTWTVLIKPYLAKLSPRSALIMISTQRPPTLVFLYVLEYSECFGAQFRFQDNPSGIWGAFRELHFTIRF
jgi:hypothetical protein